MRFITELDHILNLNRNRFVKRNRKLTIKRYKVLGVQKDFFNYVSLCVGKSLLLLQYEKRVMFIRELIRSMVFEKAMIGYKGMIETKELLLSTKPEDIISFRPESENYLTHVYITRILQPYIIYSDFGKELLDRLVKGKELDKQLIAAKLLLILCDISEEFMIVTKCIFAKNEWIRNKNLNELTAKLKIHIDMVEISMQTMNNVENECYSSN